MSFLRRDQPRGLYQGVASVALSPSGWLEVATGDLISRVYGSCRMSMVMVGIVEIRDSSIIGLGDEFYSMFYVDYTLVMFKSYRVCRHAPHIYYILEWKSADLSACGSMDHLAINSLVYFAMQGSST